MWVSGACECRAVLISACAISYARVNTQLRVDRCILVAQIFAFDSGVGEVVDRAFHAIALAVALHRVNRVVIGGLRFKALHPHAKNPCTLRLEMKVAIAIMAQAAAGAMSVVCFMSYSLNR